ncbi:hypothetical protein JHK84_050930 [Glycine max]|nr:hypothetical protein JHK84_050930 [Glycine max]
MVNKVKESIDLINLDKKERSLSMYGVYGGLDNMDIDNRLYMVKYDFEDNKEKEKFIGICPKCLYERLTILVQKSYSSVYKAPTSLIVVAAHKPIFQPFATKHI